jgi:hypothetical protein
MECKDEGWIDGVTKARGDEQGMRYEVGGAWSMRGGHLFEQSIVNCQGIAVAVGSSLRGIVCRPGIVAKPSITGNKFIPHQRLLPVFSGDSA